MEQKKYDVEKLLAQGQSVQFPIPTTSMYQFIRPGRDQVVVAPLADPKELRRGEVALYRRDGGILVLHRIWRHRDGQVYMLADNQYDIEGPLREDQFRGIMVAIVRGSREIRADSPGYWLLSRLWLWLRPVRPLVWRVHDLLRRKP